MKLIGQILKKTLLLTSLMFWLIACNKEDLGGKKALHVLVNGYNGSADELEVWIDTVKYSKEIAYGKFSLKPDALVGFNAVYTYHTARLQGELMIKEPVSGKVLFSKPLPTTGTRVNYSFIYIDGKLQEVNLPKEDVTTNKLGFYLQYTKNDDPVDIFLYRIDNTTGQEYREYIAKSVKPGNWVYVDYIASANFKNKNVLKSSNLCFTKAGTIDQWAFDDSEGMSKLDAFGLALPEIEEKGLMQPYFFRPGLWQLEVSRLFFYPDRL